jgi:protoporphyrin/coproporphyrin ferrochelatase
VSNKGSAVINGKVGVMLLNLGGPDTLDDVQPFLYNLFADPDIIRLPPPFRFLQPLIAKVISTLRAPKSAKAYKSIGGGSPLRSITEKQAEALQCALSVRGVDSHVYVAMRYWHPYTEEAIAQIKLDCIDKLVILPLYPQFSISTSGSSLRLLEEIFKSDADLASLEHTVIPSWYSRRGYVTAMADLIEEEIRRFADTESVRRPTLACTCFFAVTYLYCCVYELRAAYLWTGAVDQGAGVLAAVASSSVRVAWGHTARAVWSCTRKWLV